MKRRGVPASRAQGAFLYGDLWDFLADGIPDDSITYGYNVESLGADVNKPVIDDEEFDLVIIADGSWSQLRSKYFGPDIPRYAGWQAWRFRVPLDLVPGIRRESTPRNTSQRY